MELFLILNLYMTPMLMILLGYLWTKRFPAKINKLYGYRTKWSMLSQETWIFSNKLFSRLFLIFGFISIVTTFSMDKSKFTLIILVQLILLFIPFLITEVSLRAMFNDKGEKK
ncbi:SdpI family protein [Streptobacillus felis]|uniref:SdpI family protein n=2 Tax=Streptobacillus felis TaxID=1384509 RepID=A0A7Z0PFX6_9FUSO|nr:SdpI family protein [Streptobacillus felis]NYV27355.1 SdpI family protein [Streptobacillus felis]